MEFCHFPPFSMQNLIGDLYLQNWEKCTLSVIGHTGKSPFTRHGKSPFTRQYELAGQSLTFK